MASSNGCVAIYPGTFDPLTNGHVSLVRRALKIFGTIIVAVAEDSGKKPLFSREERVAIAEAVFEDEPQVMVEGFDGLLVNYVQKRQADVIVRGLRAVSDFEYEFQLALMNRRLKRHIETVFIMTDYRWLYISSTIIKEAVRLGGDIRGLVPRLVLERLCERYGVPIPGGSVEGE
ncbi:MAG: pantetheine-phosphate adenylyltransferase [Thermodesulfobacteriota bacterium]